MKYNDEYSVGLLSYNNNLSLVSTVVGCQYYSKLWASSRSLYNSYKKCVAIMSALSKYFLDNSGHQTCRFFLHPDETCTQQFIDMAWRSFYSMGQFYLPTLVISLLLQAKSLNRDMFIQSLIDYGKSTLIANWLVTMSFGGICWFSKIFGFYYPWFLRVPLAFGTLFFNYYPEKIKRWQSTGLLNMCIETMIKKSEIQIIGNLRKSRVFGTLMFMCFSGAIMAGFKITAIKRFWFTSLPHSNKDKSGAVKLKPCVHDGTCTHYIWKEFSKTTKLALVLGFLKFVVPNYRRIKLAQPVAAIKLLLQKLDYNMMAFTLLYNTLFKLFYCWFNNKTGQNIVENVMAAGFLSGITYSVYPIYMIFTYGLTVTLQMGWLVYSKYITNRAKDSKTSDFLKRLNRLMNFVNKLPISTIVMSVCMMQLVENRIQYPFATPVYAHNFISLGTVKRADRLCLIASEIILGIST